jgi:hypothetical protein
VGPYAAIVGITALRILIAMRILRLPLLVLALLVYTAILFTNLCVSHVRHLKRPAERHAVIMAIPVTLISTVTYHPAPMYVVFSNLQYSNIGN